MLAVEKIAGHTQFKLLLLLSSHLMFCTWIFFEIILDSPLFLVIKSKIH